MAIATCDICKMDRIQTPTEQPEQVFIIINSFGAAIHLLDRCMMDHASVVEVVTDIIARAAEQNVKILEPTFALSEFKLQETRTGDYRPFTEEIIEVDAPGQASPNLKRFTWTRIPRPMFPIDDL